MTRSPLPRGARSALALIVALALAACATHINRPAARSTAAPDRFTYSVDVQRRYTPPDWPETLYADLYRPEAPGARPAVLLVHGGGWEGGEPDDMRGIAERLAEAGFVVMNVAYRLAPAYRFPAPLHDLQAAVRWLRTHAGELGVDSTRIAGFGYSAGAHLVALLALAAATPALDAPHGGPDTRLQAVVAGGTPTDLRKFDGGRLVPQFLGGTQAEVADRYALASPAVHVTPEAPPFFLYHGGSDLLVSVDHAEDLFERLQAAGVPAEFFRMHLRGHIAAFLTDGTALERAIGFLDRTLPHR